MPIGDKSAKNWNMGREERIDLIKTRDPTGFNQINPQDSIFSLIFWIMICYYSSGMDFRHIGIPRYLKHFQSYEMGKEII
jgi:hypothetical protein